MASTTFQPPIRKSLTLSLTWLLAAILFAVTIENIWLDPWFEKPLPGLSFAGAATSKRLVDSHLWRDRNCLRGADGRPGPC